MLKNYFEIDENLKLGGFLKEIKDKKNSHYIILDTEPESFVDIRSVALKISNLNDKLKGLKKKLIICDDENASNILNLLIESGDRVIKSKEEYFDFIDALEEILKLDLDFLDENIELLAKKDIYALNIDDKIVQARNLFLQKRINLLPVLDGLKVIGELRPIDFLVGTLFSEHEHGTNFYNSNYRNNVLNLPVENLINKRPITVDKNKSLREIIEIMINKNLPSLIVVDEKENIYSVISYRDIFKLYKKDVEKPKYSIEYRGGDNLYEDEFDLIQDFAERTMKKIARISNYNLLRINFKVIGEKDTSHNKKIQARILLSEGNNVIQVEKEIITGTDDEISNNKVKKRWNITLMTQEALDVLEEKVKEENKKKNR